MGAELRAEALYSSTVTHGVHRHPMDGRSCREYVVGECALAAPAVTETDLRAAAQAVIEAVEPVPLGSGMSRTPRVGHNAAVIVALRAALAAPAVTEPDCCTMCGVPYDGSPLVLDHHAAGPHWHDPDGVTLHYRLSPDAAQREDRPAAPTVTETGERRAALDVGKVSIALQRSGALSKHLSYHDLARCFIAALTDGRTDLGAPDEHDRHKAAPAVTETDPIDAYLASPEAVEQLARAYGMSEFGVYDPQRDDAWALSLLTALRKVRAEGDDDGR